MLVRFVVQNYLSFNERTEFNMLTGTPRRLPHHVYHHGDLELLKMAAVYGANGAGKSNFVKAIFDLKDLILKGTMSLKPNKFKLNSSNNTQPICFEIEFITHGTMFHYSISCDNHIILNEKLIETKEDGTENLIFERKSKNNKIKINFNKTYNKNEQDKFRIKLYEEELLKHTETLFAKINESREGFEEIKKAFSWLSFINFIAPNISVSNMILLFPEIANFVSNHMGDFDTGISDFEVQIFSFDQFFGSNNNELKERLKEELILKNPVELNNFLNLNIKEKAKNKSIATIENGEYVVKNFITHHLNNKGEKVIFNAQDESDGSIRLWDLLTFLYFTMATPCVMFIDEIESSIHPNLVKELITKFSENKETKGQLIFTTHESNLLDQEIFRQDEIWFAEKNTDGATALFPMSDFNIRYDLDIRKGYLNGRFGAIPFLSNFKDLNWKAHVE